MVDTTADTNPRTGTIASDRGGTEPLAALVSVAAVCVAVSVYAGFVSFTTSTTGADTTARATLDSVWTAVGEDGHLDADTHPLEERLGPTVLPRGHRVTVTVTVVGEDGRLDTVDSATFDERARKTDVDPPPNAATDARPVAVRVDDGDVRPGRLTVVVWDV